MSASHDVIIIGSGAAGLTAALTLAEQHKVLVLAKGALSDGSTAWAQGGIAAVLDAGDTFEAHIEDTMVAGAGLNDRRVVEFVVENAPAAIERLASLGVPFNSDSNSADDGGGAGAGGVTLGERWHLTREGGHSHRRIVHVDDATGWAVQRALEAAAAANPNITLMPDMVAVDLISGRHGEQFSGAGNIWGVYAFNRATARVEGFTARATVLATGGAGRTYLFSTAPRGATGDGIAMAWRSGARVANMEFMQFHPTCLYNLEVKNFLITEAVRGEGGHLKLPTTGERFMPRFDAREELAPRDIVARAIDHEIKRLGLDYVHLDISHKSAEF
ncbi:MAG: FAD-dependent oxidoreductase, partial [Sphingopyxis sp.]